MVLAIVRGSLLPLLSCICYSWGLLSILSFSRRGRCTFPELGCLVAVKRAQSTVPIQHNLTLFNTSASGLILFWLASPVVPCLSNILITFLFTGTGYHIIIAAYESVSGKG